MVDVLILYEHRIREIENCCLLAAELERRGYKIRIYNIYSEEKFFVTPKVLIVPHLYNDSQLFHFVKNYKGKYGQIVNLQYEQVLSKCKEDGIHNPVGQGVNAYHLAWGDAQKQRYLRHNIDENNIVVTGHIAMDLMSPKMNWYHKSKKQISEEYNLDVTKEWVLFMSSFSYANLDEQTILQYETMYPPTRFFERLSTSSYKIIIDWLSKACEEYPDKIFIYRKHPAENYTNEILQLEKIYSNFKCIDNCSVRQWVKICEKLYTWYSTSIVDAYYAEKICYILRPMEIPNELEVDIMDGATFLTSYEDFSSSLVSDDFKFPISDDKIRFYYGNNETLAYEKIADICEQLIEKKMKEYKYSIPKDSILTFIKRIIDALSFKICKRWNIAIPKSLSGLPLINRFRRYTEEAYGINQEIQAYMRRFEPILYKKE
jgi:surface carbohydrate biosynthesis protein